MNNESLAKFKEQWIKILKNLDNTTPDKQKSNKECIEFLKVNTSQISEHSISLCSEYKTGCSGTQVRFDIQDSKSHILYFKTENIANLSKVIQKIIDNYLDVVAKYNASKSGNEVNMEVRGNVRENKSDKNKPVILTEIKNPDDILQGHAEIINEIRHKDMLLEMMYNDGKPNYEFSYEDGDDEYAFDDFLENMEAACIKCFGNPPYDVHCEGRRLNWSGGSGTLDKVFNNSKQLVQTIAGNYQPNYVGVTVKQDETQGMYISMDIYHHDSRFAGGATVVDIFQAGNENDKPIQENVIKEGFNPPSAKNITIGKKYRICHNSGVDSNKIVLVVPPSKIKVDGRGIPTNVRGAYNRVDWKNEVAIQYEDGTFGTMYKDRLIDIQEKLNPNSSDIRENVIKEGFNPLPIAVENPKHQLKFTKAEKHFSDRNPADYLVMFDGKEIGRVSFNEDYKRYPWQVSMHSGGFGGGEVFANISAVKEYFKKEFPNYIKERQNNN